MQDRAGGRSASQATFTLGFNSNLGGSLGALWGWTWFYSFSRLITHRDGVEQQVEGRFKGACAAAGPCGDSR